METKDKKKTLLERLAEGPVICAEGYLFELERRGYVQAGAFVPEVVLDDPQVVKQLHRDFLRAGSDVIEAFTYYGHREKLRLIGKEHLLESLNRNAIRLAKEVADEGNALVAGNICNTNIFDPNDPNCIEPIKAMFREQVKWAVEEGVDFIIGETFAWYGEAKLALEVIKEFKQVAVITLGINQDDNNMRDMISPEEACRLLKEQGADVVGLNCHRGPDTMLPVLERIRKVVSGPLAALPVPYRCTREEPTFFSLVDPKTGKKGFPTGLDPFVCTRDEVTEFGKKASALGVNYFGLCCGAGPHHIRSLAESLGKTPLASKYTADMSKHFSLGTDESLKKLNQDFKLKL